MSSWKSKYSVIISMNRFEINKTLQNRQFESFTCNDQKLTIKNPKLNMFFLSLVCLFSYTKYSFRKVAIKKYIHLCIKNQTKSNIIITTQTYATIITYKLHFKFQMFPNSKQDCYAVTQFVTQIFTFLADFFMFKRV